MIQAFLYDAEGRDREIELDAGVAENLAEHHILWLDVASPDAAELAKLKKLFSLKPDCVAAMRRAETSYALDNYGEYFLLNVPAIFRSRGDDGSSSKLKPRKVAPLTFVISAQWLITVRHDPVDFLQRFRDQDKGETLIGAMSGPGVAASLLDWHLAAYLDAMEDVERFADRLDERMLAPAAVRHALLEELVGGRRFISSLRRLLGPQRAVFYGLSRPDFGQVANSDAAANYAVLERRFERVLDAIDHGRELMQSSFDLFATRTAETTNMLIRRLTFLSIMIGALGSVAGVFGMNFAAPPYAAWGAAGFWAVLGTMALATAVAIAVGRARKWI